MAEEFKVGWGMWLLGVQCLHKQNGKCKEPDLTGNKITERNQSWHWGIQWRCDRGKQWGYNGIFNQHNSNSNGHTMAAKRVFWQVSRFPTGSRSTSHWVSGCVHRLWPIKALRHLGGHRPENAHVSGSGIRSAMESQFESIFNVQFPKWNVRWNWHTLRFHQTWCAGK